MPLFLRSTALAALLSVACLLPALAEITPSTSPTDSRIRYVKFVERQVFKIDAKVLTATTIQFESGEVINNVALGDPITFNYGQLSDNSIAIKPTENGVQTNMSVVTNRRTYIFELVESSKIPAYFVEFIYPKSGRRTTSAINPPSASSRTYLVQEASKAQSFMPVQIWDDGSKTYMRFSRNAAIPAAFRADGNGREYTVQTKVENGVLILPGVQDRWVLRLGNSVICIWSDRLRNALIAQGKDL